VHEGVVFSVRILLLFLTTGLLAQTTAPREVAAGLERLLAPLAVLGVRPGRLSRSLSLSWTSFPVLWKSVRLMAARGRGRSGWFNRAVHLPGDIVADLYLLADRAASEPGPEG
jgi:biotin transport system permease protein